MQGDDRVVEALNTIVRSVVGQELESIRGSVEELRADLSRRIDGVKEETASRIEDSKRELSERVEALDRRLSEAEASREQALAGLGDRTDQGFAELKSRLEAVHAEAQSRDEANRSALERDLEAADRGLKEHLDELACKLVTVEQGLRQQMETSERLKSVLSNLGNIFSAQAAAVTPGTAGATLSEADDRNELENALDKVFPVGS